MRIGPRSSPNWFDMASNVHLNSPNPCETGGHTIITMRIPIRNLIPMAVLPYKGLFDHKLLLS